MKDSGDFRKHGQGATCMQQDLLNRFCSTSGYCSFLEDLSLTFTNKIDKFDPFKRKEYWRSTPKTMTPFEVSTWHWRKCLAVLLPVF